MASLIHARFFLLHLLPEYELLTSLNTIFYFNKIHSLWYTDGYHKNDIMVNPHYSPSDTTQLCTRLHQGEVEHS